MAATTVQPVSKSAKKKAAKAIERAESPAPSATSAVEKTGDEGFESPYIKELQKYATADYRGAFDGVIANLSS